MKLKSIRIENFRSFGDATIHLDPYTCLVGPNGAGKSAVLTALNLFFRNTATPTNLVALSAEDFHHRDISRPVKITLSFADLSLAAQEDLKHYYRQGQLVVSARANWDPANQNAPVTQHGSRLVMQAFAPYFEALDQGVQVAQLREKYKELQTGFADLPHATTKEAMTRTLREYEEAHPDQCQLIEDSKQFYGWTKGTNLLRPHIQWVYVPAVKDATTEQEENSKTALGQLLERTIRSKVKFEDRLEELRKKTEAEYCAILDSEKAVLSGLQASMEARLREWATPGAALQLSWHYDRSKSLVISEPVARAQIGEDTFLGEVARLGHGMQRSFLVALLHELASVSAEEGPTLLLGVEEPELYQHPPQARHVARVLESLSHDRRLNSQVIVTTHSPYFISTRGFESVRLVQKDRTRHCSLVKHATYDRIAQTIGSALNQQPGPPSVLMAQVEQIMQPSQRELYFSRLVVLVEGTEDIAFIATHLQLRGRLEAFRGHGCHFVVTGGKNAMSRPLAIALEMGIPVFVVCDGDTNNENGTSDPQRDNGCILRLCGYTDVDPLPKATVWKTNLIMWHTDISTVVSEGFGPDWSAAMESVRARLNLPGGKKTGVREKNSLLITATLEDLASRDRFSTTLDRLVDAVLAFASSVGAHPAPT